MGVDMVSISMQWHKYIMWVVRFNTAIVIRFCTQTHLTQPTSSPILHAHVPFIHSDTVIITLVFACIILGVVSCC